jgi:hypothetical protein
LTPPKGASGVAGSQSLTHTMPNSSRSLAAIARVEVVRHDEGGRPYSVSLRERSASSRVAEALDRHDGPEDLVGQHRRAVGHVVEHVGA